MKYIGISIYFLLFINSLTEAQAAEEIHPVFDEETVISYEGTIFRVLFSDPAAEISLFVGVSNQKPVKKSFEWIGASVLMRQGIRMNTFKPGDRVRVFANPPLEGAFEDGELGGKLLSIISLENDSNWSSE